MSGAWAGVWSRLAAWNEEWIGAHSWSTCSYGACLPSPTLLQTHWSKVKLDRKQKKSSKSIKKLLKYKY